ncbi:MAG: hypothetical protein ISR91_06935, partial [Candidatus Delongbacteria bacterium]|nr:hypothetical protein [Candidatus Delongbacteria bacterium]
MQKLLILTLVLYGTLYTSLLVAGTEPANQLTLVNAGQDGCRVSVTLQEDGLVEVETAAGLYHAIQQEGMVPVAATGDPALQALAWTLEIPATSDLQYQLEYEVTLFENIDLIPEVLDSGSSVPEKLGDRWQQDSFYPSQLVTLSDPAIMRNHRLVQVTLTPYQYNPVRRQLRVYHNVELDFTFAGVNRINQLERTVPRSATFEKMLAQNVINYEEMNQNARDWDANLGLDPILYIYNSACQSVLDSLLWWKQERGHTVYTATQNDVTLTSYTSVKSYIQTAYDSWDNPPVFVVLVGDPTSCSFGTVAASNSYGDHDYSRLEGGDILADIFVGRMSVGSSSQLETVVHKQLSYESYPYVADPGWFNSAHLIGDDSLSGMSMVFTNENIRLKILGEGLTNVTTCYAYQGCNEVNSLIAAFNNGISFFNYRGWLGMSGWSSHSANELSNSHQLPFVVAITCGTGDYTSGTSISEDFYRAGSDSNPKGGVAAIGTATSGTHTRYNNAVDLGVFGGIFDQDQATGGEVMFQGKFELWQAYNSVDPGQVTNFSNWNNLIGDPSLELRVGTPLELEVTHPGELVSGASGYPVLVTKSGTPLPGILVCMHQHGGAQVKLLTNAAGEAILPLAGQFTGGTATLTVVAHNRYPYQQRMNIINQSFWVDSYGAIMDDDNNGGSSGNADGLLNPGEQIELTLQLINRGTSETATGVSASVNCADPRITVLQDNSTFPDIAPGATVSSNILYQFSLANLIDQEFPSTVLLEVDVTTSGGDFNTVLQLELVQPLLSPVLIETDPDGDDLISRGETGEIHLSLENRGTLATGTLNATLTTADPQVTIVTGTLTYGNIPPGGIVPNLTPFLVRPDGDIFNGHLAELTLTVTTPEGYQQMMTSSFNVGPLVTGDPLGPVEEYYCFDSGDTYYSQHPVYD